MTMPSNLVAVLGEESSLTGRFVGQDLTILGHFDGDLKAAGVVKIGRNAQVRATIDAGAVEVEGLFEGEIRTSRLFFGAGAKARGVFRSDRLMVQDGAIVDGAVNQPPAPKEEAVAQPTSAVEPVVAEAATDSQKPQDVDSAVSETGTASENPPEDDSPAASPEGFPYVALASPDSASVTYAATGLVSTPSWHPQHQRRHRRRHM